MNSLIFVVHAFCCFFMTGLIWLIQLIHYPMFRFINPTEFSLFHQFHSRVITLIVGPVMALELATGLAVLIAQRMSLWSSLNFIALVGIWLSTAFFSVPAHSKLSASLNMEVLSFLVNSNWIRTILWTLRSALLCGFLWMSVKNYEIKF